MGKEKRSAFEEAARYMENRMRTVHEVKQQLKEKEYNEEEITEAVEDLLALHYLDDNEYAMRYFEYAYEKKRGRLRIFRELEEKGIDRQTVQYAFEDYLYEHGNKEFEAAMRIAEIEAEGRIVDEKLVARIARKLESRGYSGDDIIKVLSEVRRWKNQERETEEQ